MDAQTYYFVEEGFPESAEPAAAPAAKAERPRPVASVEVPRRVFPAPRPATGPAPRPAPGNNQAVKPAAATGWKSPRRAEKVGGSRPPFRPTRSFSPAEGRKAGKIASGPGSGVGAPRPERRPDTRGGARQEKRQSAPLGAQNAPQTGPKNSPGKERRMTCASGREPGAGSAIRASSCVCRGPR